MSASITPTLRLRCAIATAMFAVILDFPTPPLPDPMRKIRVRVSASNGFVRGGLPARNFSMSEARSPSVMTDRDTRIASSLAKLEAADRTSRSILSLAGQPTTVSFTSISTWPAEVISARPIMPSSVSGRRSSGSITRLSASRSSWLPLISLRRESESLALRLPRRHRIDLRRVPL